MEYLNSTVDYKLQGIMCDNQEDVELWLFVDADLAGDPNENEEHQWCLPRIGRSLDLDASGLDSF